MSYRRAMGYLRAMPRLRAEENLEFAAAVAVGSGTLKQHDSDRIQREWREQTGDPEARQQPETQEEFLTGAAAAGIKVELVNA